MKIAKITGSLILGSSLLFAGFFTVKSAKVEYKTTRAGTFGKGPASLKIDEKSTSRLVLDDYGKRELNEKESIEKTTMVMIKQTETKKRHTLTFMEGTTVFDVNFKSKKIQKRTREDPDLDKMSYDDLMKQVGAKKIGSDKVLEWECTVWQLDEMKLCVYKGIPLRTETEENGIKSVEIATKAAFDLEMTESDFTLPDYPIVEEKEKK